MGAIKKKTKEASTHEAYMGIRRMFFLNEIVPGQKLSYQFLANRLNMGITPVRHALKHLEFQGLVRHELNRGYYTEEISIKEINEIYEFRELIEVSLLPAIIEKMTKVKLKRLKNALDSYLDAVKGISLQKRMGKDMELHLKLAEFSEKKIQIKTLKSLFDLLYLKYRMDVLFFNPMSTVDEEHIQLYDDIATGNLDAARAMLKKHISNVKNHAIECIKRMNNPT